MPRIIAPFAAFDPRLPSVSRAPGRSVGPLIRFVRLDVMGIGARYVSVVTPSTREGDANPVKGEGDPRRSQVTTGQSESLERPIFRFVGNNDCPLLRVPMLSDRFFLHPYLPVTVAAAGTVADMNRSRGAAPIGS